MKLCMHDLKSGAFEGTDYILPAFDIEEIRSRGAGVPRWLHFGAGNILRAFPCMLLQKLLEDGYQGAGMTVCAVYDEENIYKAFRPYDNLALYVALKGDGSIEKHVVGSISESLAYSEDQERLTQLFASPDLQLVTLTITEKGYAVTDADNQPLAYCAGDFLSMDHPASVCGILAKLLYVRYLAGQLPLTMLSLDNCSHNGTALKNSVMKIILSWKEKNLVPDGFVSYVQTEEKVSFPWSMIDKITPRPSQAVMDLLKKDGFEDANLTVTRKNTYISAMVNAEECQYLAIEDRFPAGRPPLEKVGVLFCDRETVEKIEKMKVCTCLNPLHTCLALFGCMLGYTRISDEMKDSALVGFIRRIGYDEGMPVVVNPGVMNAKDFIDEVITRRFPNPFVPDTPQRIACDSSQKISVRFGETLKAYIARGKTDLSFLTFIPLVFAGYARYLTQIDDEGKPFTLSPDPRLDELTEIMRGFSLGAPFDTGRLRKLFSDGSIFGVDLYAFGLGGKAEAMFAQMAEGSGAIRRTIEHYLNETDKEASHETLSWR